MTDVFPEPTKPLTKKDLQNIQNLLNEVEAIFGNHKLTYEQMILRQFIQSFWDLVGLHKKKL